MVFVRRDVYSLGPDHPIITAYGDAVAAMRAKPASDPTSWAYQAAIHGVASSSPPPLANECRHQSWYFVVWHRMYLYWFERIVRAQVLALGGPADWALPFWDYDRAGTRAIPPAFRSPTRPDGSANPLFVAQRNPGINAGGEMPPAVTTAAFALSRPDYIGTAEFGGGIASPNGQFMGRTGRLEQTPHNDVHVTIGGLMGNPRTAAQDPIFWLHHANIDRLWWEWRKTHADPNQPEWTLQSFPFFDETGAQVSRRCEQVEAPESQLDYTYPQQVVFRPIFRLPVNRFKVRPWWPDWIKEFPIPMPKPPFPPEPQPGPDPVPFDRPLELIGATDREVRLVGEPERIRVAVDRRAREAALTGRDTPVRVVLDLQNIEADAAPGTVYGVFVNLPEGASQEEEMAHHVGNVSLFGIERVRDPENDEHAHGGMRVAMDITDLVERLAAQDRWNDDEVEVTLQPLALDLKNAVVDDEEARSAGPRHDDLPIRIGRVSLHVG